MVSAFADTMSRVSPKASLGRQSTNDWGTRGVSANGWDDRSGSANGWDVTIDARTAGTHTRESANVRDAFGLETVSIIRGCEAGRLDRSRMRGWPSRSFADARLAVHIVRGFGASCLGRSRMQARLSQQFAHPKPAVPSIRLRGATCPNRSRTRSLDPRRPPRAEPGRATAPPATHEKGPPAHSRRPHPLRDASAPYFMSSSGSSNTRLSMMSRYHSPLFLSRRVRASSSSTRTSPYRFLNAFMGDTLSVNAHSM